MIGRIIILTEAKRGEGIQSEIFLPVFAGLKMSSASKD